MNNRPDWLKFSDNTRKPSQMAVKLFTDMVPKKDSERICAIQDALEQGKRFPELIAVEGQNGELILNGGPLSCNCLRGEPV